MSDFPADAEPTGPSLPAGLPDGLAPLRGVGLGNYPLMNPPLGANAIPRWRRTDLRFSPRWSLTDRTIVVHMSNMTLKWLSTRDLVSRPGAALKSLPYDGAALVTSNGKPRALLLAVNEDSFLEDVTGILGYLGTQGAQRARAKAEAAGRANLSDEAINGVIAKTRTARRRAK